MKEISMEIPKLSTETLELLKEEHSQVSIEAGKSYEMLIEQHLS